MRYESFYPFAQQQPSAPIPMGQMSYNSPPPMSFGPSPQMGFGPPPQMGYGQGQVPGQQAQGASPAGNPFGGPGPGSAPGQGQQQGPSRMESYMQTANQFLNTAQQFAPMVQQFAPMVQNLPAMWRLYKGFQGLPAAGGIASGAAATTQSASAVASRSLGASIPRIFQP